MKKHTDRRSAFLGQLHQGGKPPLAANVQKSWQQRHEPGRAGQPTLVIPIGGKRYVFLGLQGA
jgi:hypothetical protein